MSRRMLPPALPDLSYRDRYNHESGSWEKVPVIVHRYLHPTLRGYVVTVDDEGTARSGPAGSWWSELTPRRRGACGIGFEIPVWRLRAWNVAAVVYAVAATYLAWRLGELVPFLAILAALVVVAGAGLWWIHATMPARYARQIGQSVPVKAPQTSTPAQGAGVRPEQVVEGVR